MLAEKNARLIREHGFLSFELVGVFEDEPTTSHDSALLFCPKWQALCVLRIKHLEWSGSGAVLP
jgi:hypothetical protein